MLTFHHSAEVLRAHDIDPHAVLAEGATEDGYLTFTRHQHGEILPTESERLDLYRVPWPSRDVWLAFRNAMEMDEERRRHSSTTSLIKELREGKRG